MKPLFNALSQPEYVHVLLNPLPVYGLAVGVLGLTLAMALRSRSAQVVALIIILVCAASAWPVYQYGERGYYRVRAMADADGVAWLNAHRQRAETLIGAFYALAGVAAVAIACTAAMGAVGLTAFCNDSARRDRRIGTGGLDCLCGRQGAPPGVPQ